MAKTTPPDRFDDVPEDLTRVGAHRAPMRQGRGWIGFAWAALATGLLVLAGVVGLALLTDSINLDLPFAESEAPAEEVPTSGEPEEPEAVEPVAPLLDPDVAITVLNGTSTAGLAGSVGDKLVAEGWCGAAGPETVAEGPCVNSTAVGSRANAASADVAVTVVHYGDPADEAAALALVASLGIGSTQLSEEYPESPITVIVGMDYLQIAG